MLNLENSPQQETSSLARSGAIINAPDRLQNNNRKNEYFVYKRIKGKRSYPDLISWCMLLSGTLWPNNGAIGDTVLS